MQLYIGVVESREDPLKVGRCQVRVFGVHSESKTDVPTSSLPWAIPLLPITSAGISGIGASPTGLVEGTHVFVFFQDEDSKQQPIMMGSIPGIPSAFLPLSTSLQEDEAIKFADEENPNVLVDSDGNPIVDSDGNPVRYGDTPKSIKRSVEPLKTKSETKVTNWELGKTSERYESGGKGPGTINNYENSEDPGGASYGTYQFASFLPKLFKDGRSRPFKSLAPIFEYLQYSDKFRDQFVGLTPATKEFDDKWKEVARIYTKEFKEDQHEYTKRKYYDVAASTLKKKAFDYQKFGPAFQDLIWSSAVQFGPSGCVNVIFDGLGNSTASGLSEVEIVTKIMDYKINNVRKLFSSLARTESSQVGTAASVNATRILKSLEDRFRQEKKDLLELATNYNAEEKVSPDPENDVDYSDPGKFNFNAKNALLSQVEKNPVLSDIGFSDPNGKYPKYIKEQDSNRLARSQSIGKTIVDLKERNRVTSVDRANNKALWSEPLSPYAAIYPFNQVLETESGHVMEFDDTPRAERIHTYHRSGTYTEIDRNGRSVTRIVGDKYEIVDRNGYISIAGQCSITVSGDCNLLVKGDLDAQVDGDTTINCNNDLDINAAGSISMTSKEEFKVKAASINLTTTDAEMTLFSATEMNVHGEAATDITSKNTVSINGDNDVIVHTEGGFKVGAAAAVTLYSTGDVSVDGSNFYMQSGKAMPTPMTAAPAKNDLRQLAERTEYSVTQYEDQTTSFRTNLTDFNFESEEEEQDTTNIINIGVTTQEDLDRKGVEVRKEAGSSTPTMTKDSIIPDFAAIDSLTEYPYTLSISPNFKLSSVITETAASRGQVLQDQFGLTKTQIVKNLSGLALNVLEQVKQKYPDMVITSCLRNHNTLKSPAVSKHCFGVAADIQFRTAKRSDYFEIAKRLKDELVYDKFLLEYRDKAGGKTIWLHIEYDIRNAAKQKTVLTLNNDKTVGTGLIDLA